MSVSFLRGASELALMVMLVFGAGAFARADQDDSKNPVIQIGQADDGSNENVKKSIVLGDGDQQREVPKFWIGLGCGPISADHVLRAHIDLPEGQGLLVASVAPNSPAQKAGVKPNDILLRANNAELHEVHDLIDLVTTEGGKKGQIALEVLRHGKRDTVYVTPEDRPADVDAQPQPGGEGGDGGGFGEFGEGGLPPQMLEQFRNRIPMEFRNFGPGGEGQGAVNMPEGVSINIQKEGDKPAHITVKRGDETWEVVGDDPKSLEKLPKELRPAVENMLHGGGPRMNMHMGQLRDEMPNLGDGRLRERLEKMERQLDELSKQLQEKHSAPEPKTDEKK